MRTDIGPFALVPLWLLPLVDASGLKVYVALATFANTDGEAWPSVGSIAERAGCSENTVRAAVKALIGVGAIRAFPRVRENGSASSHLYVLCFARCTLNSEGGVLQNLKGGTSKFEPPELDPIELDNDPKGSKTRAKKKPEVDWSLSVPIPDELRAIRGFEKAWSARCRQRMAEKKTRFPTVDSVDAELGILMRVKDPISILQRATASGWQGLNVRPEEYRASAPSGAPSYRKAAIDRALGLGGEE